MRLPPRRLLESLRGSAFLRVSDLDALPELGDVYTTFEEDPAAGARPLLRRSLAAGLLDDAGNAEVSASAELVIDLGVETSDAAAPCL